MKQILLLVMAVAVGLTSVGCSKENPPRPAADSSNANDAAGHAKWKAAYEHAMEEWWGNLVVCLHCSSDLVKKGAKVCAECGKDQKPLIANPIVEQAIRDELFGPPYLNEGEPDEPVINVAYELTKADLAKLTDLSLSDTKITDAGLKDIAKLQQLKRLSLINTKITDAGLKEVVKLQNLRSLYLYKTKITDAGLKDVAKMQSLTHLELNNNNITDAGLKEVAKLKQLTILYLGDTKITDAGLKELAKLQQLRRLRLSRTKVTKAGVAKLKKALPKCNILSNPTE